MFFVCALKKKKSFSGATMAIQPIGIMVKINVENIMVILYRGDLYSCTCI